MGEGRIICTILWLTSTFLLNDFGSPQVGKQAKKLTTAPTLVCGDICVSDLLTRQTCIAVLVRGGRWRCMDVRIANMYLFVLFSSSLQPLLLLRALR